MPQLGHTERVTAAALSPDGRLLLTGAGDRTARLWDVTSGKELRAFVGHDREVVSVAFAPDGLCVVTGAEDGTGRLWDAATGKELRAFAHARTKGPVGAVAVSPSGSRLVTAGGAVARVWDAGTGREVCRLAGRAGTTRSAAFSPDGARVLTAGDDGARLWDAETGKEDTQFVGHTGAVRWAAFSADGARVATASDDKTARVWDAGTGKELLRLGDHPKGVSAVAFSPDGRQLVTASGGAAVWDAATGAALARFGAADERIEWVAFAAGGERVLTKNEDGDLRLWDPATGRARVRFEGLSVTASAVAFSPDGGRVLSGGNGGAGHLWEVSTGREVRRFTGHEGGVDAVAFAPDGREVLTGGTDGTVRLWGADTGLELRQFKGSVGAVRSVAFVQDGKYVLGCSQVAHLWDRATGRRVSPAQGLLNRRVWHAVLSGAAAGRVLTVNGHGGAAVWDPVANRELRAFADLPDEPAPPRKDRKPVIRLPHQVSAAALSPDGKRVVTGSNLGSISLWDADTGAELRRLAGVVPTDGLVTNRHQVDTVAFSPDGRRAVTVRMDDGPDHRAQVWDVGTGKEVCALSGAVAAGAPAAFSPDGRLVLAKHADGTPWLWAADTGKPLCSLVSLKGRGWAAVTPSGRFDAEDLDAVRGFVWVAPDEPFRALAPEVFMRDYYEPKLLSRLLAGEKFAPVRSLAELNRVQPAVKVAKVTPRAGAGDEVDVTVEVAQQAHPFERVGAAPPEPEPGPAAPAARPRLVAQTGHSGTVQSAVFSADGRLLLTGGMDRTAILWDVASGAKLQQFQGHAGNVLSVALAPDARHVATADDGGEVRLWSVATGEPVRSREHKPAARAVAFSRDGLAVLLVGSSQVTEWSVATGETGRAFAIKPGPFGVQTVSHGVGWFRQLGRKEGLVGWGLETGEKYATVPEIDEGVHDAGTDAAGTRLIVATGSPVLGRQPSRAAVYALPAGKEERAFDVGDVAVLSVALSRDGALAAVGTYKKGAHVFDTATGRKISAVGPIGWNCYGVAFAPDGRHLLVRTEGTVQLYDFLTTKLVREFRGSALPVSELHAADAAGRLVVRYRGGERVAWDLAGGRPSRAQTRLGDERVAGYDPATDRVLVESPKRDSYTLFELAPRKRVAELGPGLDIVSGAAFAGRDRIVTVDERIVRVWDAAGKYVAGVKHGLPADPKALFPQPELHVSDDGKRFVLELKDAVAVWSTDPLKEVCRLDGFKGYLYRAVFAGDTLATASLGGGDGDFHKVRFWDAKSGKHLRDVTVTKQMVGGFALSPDGKRLATGDQAGAVALWDAATGRQVWAGRGHWGSVGAVAFSPDGTRLYSAGDDGTLRLWDLRTGEWRLAVAYFAGGSWAVFDRDGRFDASDLDAVRGLHWVVPDEPLRALSPQVFMRDYYEPKLLARTLAGEKLPPVRSLAELNRVQPAVKVSKVAPRPGSADEVDVTVEVAQVARTFTRVGAAAPAQEPKPEPKPAAPAPAAANPQLVAQTRHAQQIVAVAIAPDGKLALTGSEDQTVRLWDTDTGKLLRVFRGSSPLLPVRNALLFSPDGTRFLVGGFDGRVTVFELASGRELRVIAGGDKFITCATFAPDGKSVLTAWLLDKTVRQFDLATGKEVLKLELTGEPKAAALSPDGARVLTADQDGDARLWDARTGKPLRQFEERQRADARPGTATPWTEAVAFSPDGKRVVTGNSLGTTRIWDADKGTEVKAFQADKDFGDITDVALSADGKRVFTGSYACRLWDAETGKELRVLNPGGQASCAGLSADGRRLVTSDVAEGRFVGRVWDAAAGAHLRDLTGDTNWVYFAAFSPDGRFLLTDGLNGTARLWDTETGRERLTFRGHTQAIRAATFSADGKRLLTGSFDRTAKLWDVATGNELLALKGHKDTVSAVGFSADGKKLVTGSWDSTIRVWSADTGAEVQSFADPGPVKGGGAVLRRVGSAVFSADGAYVLTSSWGAVARLWNVETGKEAKTFVGHKDVVVSARFSPDGKSVVTASGDGTARLWDVESGAETKKLEGHTGGLPAADFSPDGSQILTGGVDGTARLWDVKTGAELRAFRRHDDFVNSARFAPDGRRVVTAGSDGSMRVWNVADARELCRVVGFKGGDWAVVAPDGRFDASNLDAVRGLHWVMPDEPFRALAPEVFMRDYYEPKLLALVLSGAKLPPVRSLAELNRVQPAVKVAKVVPRPGAPDEADVTVEVAQQARTFERVSAVPPAPEPVNPRLVVQTGHIYYVRSVAFDPTGKLLVSTALGDWTARLWDATGGRELLALKGHTADVRSAVFSPDSKWIVTASFDRTARVWSAATGAEVRRFAHTGGVESAVFSPDGKRIVTAGTNGITLLWDAETGAELRRFEGVKHPVLAVVFSPNGEQVATASSDRTVCVWNAGTGRAAYTLIGHGGAVNGVMFSRDGKRIVTSSSDNTARVWEAGTGDHLLRLDHASDVRSAAFSPDGKTVATAGSDRPVRLWDAVTGKEVKQLAGHDGPVNAVTFSPDGTRVATAAGDRTARIWDVASGKEVRRLWGLVADLRVVGFAPGGEKLVTAGDNSSLCVWNAGTGRPEARIYAEGRAFAGDVKAVAFGPGGRFFVTAGRDRTAQIWDSATGKELRQLVHASAVLSVAVSPDGRWIATGTMDKTAHVWSAENGKEVHKLVGHKGNVVAVAFDPEGKRVVTGSYLDTVVRVWDTHTGKETLQFVGGVRNIRSVGFSPDGKSLITASDDTAGVGIWDATTGKTVGTFPGHGTITHVASFSTDGKRILTAGGDRSARVWDAETQKEICRIGGEADPVQSAAFSADAKLVLTAGEKTARVWNSTTGAEVCRVVLLWDGNWIVSTPSGRFDASDLDTIKGVHWVAPDEPFRPLPVEIFMRDYYEPKLLARVLAGEKFSPVRSLAELNRVQPAVKVAKVAPRGGTPDEADVTVEVAARAQPLAKPAGPVLVESGAFDLHLFRDGQLVGLKDGKLDLDPKTGRATVTFERVKLPRVDGKKEVEFSAYAFNADRVKSDTARSKHALPPGLAPRKGTAYVICVGVNGFDEPKWDLRFAVPDAKLMAATLTETLKAGGQYENVVVVPLLSEPRADKDGKRAGNDSTATKANLRAALAALAGQNPDPELVKALPAAAGLRAARPEDLVVVTFSTHGYNGTDGRFYLFPSDVGTGHGKKVTDALLKRAVSTDELSEWLRGVDAGEMVMVVDACHSAGSVEADGFKPGPMGSRGLGQLAYNKRMRVLAASQADDVALESDRVGHGLLTFALCKNGLAGGKADFEPADGKVTLGEWLRFGVRNVPEVLADIAGGKEKRAVSLSGRPLVPVDGPPNIAQQPSLFDFTRGTDGVTLRAAQKK